MKKQKNVTRCSALLLMSLFVGANSASANMLKQNEGQIPFIQNLVERSDLIFQGTLTNISEGLSVEEIPYTFVTYKIKEIITGQYANDTITLKFVGGVFPNGNRLSATNTPNVKLGEKAILMVQQSKNTGCDFVNCEHGRFVLQNEQIIAANESAIVIDDLGGIDYISLAARKSGIHKASLAKSNISSFINKIKSLSKSSVLKSKSTKIQVVDTDKFATFEAYPALTRAMKGPKAPISKTLKSDVVKPTGTAHDQWETAQLKANGGNPILNVSYPKNKTSF